MTNRKPKLGVDYLEIPCHTDGPSKSIRPDYIFGQQRVGPYGIWKYECPRCHERFYGYHAAAKHMGLVSNIMGSCDAR